MSCILRSEGRGMCWSGMAWLLVACRLITAGLWGQGGIFSCLLLDEVAVELRRWYVSRPPDYYRVEKGNVHI